MHRLTDFESRDLPNEVGLLPVTDGHAHEGLGRISSRRGLFALTSRYLPGQRSVARVVALLLSACVVAATVVVLRRGGSSGRRSLHAMGLVICAAVLIAPYNRVYDMLILWIPICFLLTDWEVWAAESWVEVAGLAVVMLALTFSFHATVYTMVVGCLWLLETGMIGRRMTNDCVSRPSPTGMRL